MPLMDPEFILERHQYGWLIKAPLDRGGIPMDALKQLTPLFSKSAVMDGGVAFALEGIVAVGEPEDCKKWSEDIEKHLAACNIPDEFRWIRGTDTGRSSATIFAALSNDSQATYELIGRYRSLPAIPCDADDFGRCWRLVERFKWRDRLPEVEVKYPGSGWREVVELWDLLADHYAWGRFLDVSQALRPIGK